MNKAIHGAVRRDLARFIGALESFPAGDQDRAEQLSKAWSNHHFELTYHHEGEHEIAWPSLQQVGVRPELLAELDTEHDAMATAMADTGAAMTRLRTTASQEDAEGALAAFRTLQDVTVAHLDHEEAEIESVYLANREAPAIKEMGRKFGKVSPARGGHFFAWVSDGASAEELAAIKGNVPGPVYSVLTTLFGRRYRKEIATVWQA